MIHHTCDLPWLLNVEVTLTMIASLKLLENIATTSAWVRSGLARSM
jgi:hypothetical protein